MNNKKTKSIKEIVTIDHSTGEIIQTTQTKDFVIKTTVDKFYMTFIDFAAPIFSLKQGIDKSIIAKLCCMAEFNTGTVKLTSQDRVDICDYLNISKQQLTNSLAKLKKLNLLNGSGGNYVINPQIFWKGDMKSRSEALNNSELKMVFKFESE